jgi:hypothetical protein
VLPYRDGLPIAPGYRLESEINSGLVYGGLAVFAAPYVSGIVAAAASDFTKDSGWLALPIAGPFLAMGGRSINCSFTEITVAGETEIDLNAKEAACRASALKEARVVALLTVAGLVQTAGAILTVAGLVSRNEYLVRKDLAPEPEEKPAVTVDGGYSNGQARLTAQINF